MGTLAIIISGMFGSILCLRKDFSQNWIFLVNLCFSLYLAFFLTPNVVLLLDIPGLPAGYKNMIALGGIFLVMDFILKKIVEQIWTDTDLSEKLPQLPAKIGSLFAGFMSGSLLAAIVILCFIQTPFSNSLHFRENLQSASGNTMLILVKTLHGLSGQWVDTGKMSELQALGIVPAGKEKEATPASVKDEKTSTEEKKPEEKTVEKSSDEVTVDESVFTGGQEKKD